MHLLYIVLSLGIIILLLFRKQIDFVAVGAVTFILYSIPCVSGETWVFSLGDFVYFDSVASKTYLCVNLQLAVIFLFTCFVKTKDDDLSSYNISIDEVENKKSLFWRNLLIVCVIVFAYNILFVVGLDKFFSDAHKSEVIEEFTGAMSIATWGALACFFYFFARGEKTEYIISFLMVFFLFILGSRAYITTAILGAFFVKSNGSIRSFWDKAKIIIIGAVVVSFLAIYKYVYVAVRGLDFDSVEQILTDSDGVSFNLLNNEEFITVFSIYNYVVDSNFEFPIEDTVARCVSIIPFANSLIDKHYSIRLADIAKDQFFGTHFGVGSNFWAESYAMGGILFVLLITVLWLFLLNIANDKLKRNKDRPFIVLVATYCSFYIHRLDWVQVFGCMKNAILIYLLYMMFSIFVTRDKKII